MLHVLAAISLVALVLIQHGKGASMGASFGSGASQTVFGSQGSTSFLAKVTGAFALIFLLTSLSLGYLATHQAKNNGGLQITAPVEAPAPATSKE